MKSLTKPYGFMCRQGVLTSFTTRASTIHQQRLYSSSKSHETAPPPAKKPQRQIIFSGIQPTGVPHLGNYLGALQQWKVMQDNADPETTDLIFSVVDLHAITVPQERGNLRKWKREMLAALLAIGLDPKRCTIFYQSMVPAHSELQWILSCTASTGYLSRMTQWKSKLQLADDADMLDDKAKSSLKHGLFSYPILQAADILVHRATHVPVGEDQRQHLEFARECVTNFNHAYKGNVLVAPETILSPTKRVMSLQSPKNKMSKSDPNPASRILLTDSPAVIHDKINKAKTDSLTPTLGITYDPVQRPGVSNLLQLLSHFDARKRSPQEIAAQINGEMWDQLNAEGAQNPMKKLKEKVSEVVQAELNPIRERYLELLEGDKGKEGGYLDEIIQEGARKANASAERTMQRVRRAVELGA